VEIRVSEDPAVPVAELLGEAAARGGNLVLTGGSTPRRAYEMAARAGVDWSGATIWLSDERCVGPGDGRSNLSLIEGALVSRLPKDAQPEVFRMEGELGPEIGAANYEAELRARMGNDPRWDLVLVGLGPDAHVASLFPGKPEVEERGRLVAGVEYAGWDPFIPRITLTLPALNAGRRVLFLVTGKDKAAAMKRAFGDPVDPTSPAAHVRPRAGELIVFCDEAAAAEL
jgi:6-phosphogluconolactonase